MLQRNSSRWPASGPSLALGLVLILSVLTLTACERKKPAVPVAATSTPAVAVALPVLPLKVGLKATACGEHCASFSADWLRFPTQPRLDAALLKTLAGPTASSPEQGLQLLAKAFMGEAREAGEPWEQIAKAVLRPGLNSVSVVDVENYTYTGGAHGMTTVSYVNWDSHKARVVTLADMLLPGQDKAFYAALKRAHGLWVKQHDDAISFEAGWPFDRSDNVALLPDSLSVKYQPYSIGPYSEGTPELHLAYADLKTIFKPEYLPKP